MTSDGMLSCYTPFLLAIVQRRVADSAARGRPTAKEADASPLYGIQPGSSVVGDGGNDCGGGDNDTGDFQDENATNAASGTNQRGTEGGDACAAVPSSCPASLCVEALRTLSEYAVLSPGLAVAKVLPLAEGLAGDTTESPKVHY